MNVILPQFNVSSAEIHNNRCVGAQGVGRVEIRNATFRRCEFEYVALEEGVSRFVVTLVRWRVHDN